MSQPTKTKRSYLEKIQMTRHLNQHRASNRLRGFTLIELLVVMTVIAILVGILAVAVGAAFRRASLFTIQQEMSQMEGAIDKFKTQYGFYPPSFKFIPDPNDPNDPIKAANRLLAYMNRIAPNHIEGNGTPGNRPIDIWWNEVGVNLYAAYVTDTNDNGADLVFWLSGLSKNKQRPLTIYDQVNNITIPLAAHPFSNEILYTDSLGNDVIDSNIERDVFFDFKGSRLNFQTPVDKVVNYFQASGAQVPYLYLDSESYNPSDANSQNGAYVDPNGDYMNPKSFQLITFGIDGLPGNVAMGTGTDWSQVGPEGVDNVVNFAGDGPNTLETLLLGTN